MTSCQWHCGNEVTHIYSRGLLPPSLSFSPSLSLYLSLGLCLPVFHSITLSFSLPLAQSLSLTVSHSSLSLLFSHLPLLSHSLTLSPSQYFWCFSWNRWTQGIIGLFLRRHRYVTAVTELGKHTYTRTHKRHTKTCTRAPVNGKRENEKGKIIKLWNGLFNLFIFK